jgi:hypothetical protein
MEKYKEYVKGYEVSNLGNIRRIGQHGTKPLKGSIQSTG